MNKLRDKLMHGSEAPSRWAIPREVGRLSGACLWYGFMGLPLAVGRELITAPILTAATWEARFCELFGDRTLRLFNALGPIYGKAGQIVLSRLSPPMQEIATTLQLTRLYKDWPPLPFSEVAVILDRNIPTWRTELTVDTKPLGVASLAQVHGAVDAQGRQWVLKVIKPQAKARLLESVAAMEQIAKILEPMAMTQVARRGLREWRELAVGFRREASLSRERDTIERVRAKLAGRRQKVLVIPEVNGAFCTDEVLTVERFSGVSLADVVTGKEELPTGSRARLARTMLSELLIQVFELGLFHADPHAGNLILTADGSVGLFDWGLSGELLENDRRHIASILKAVIALDLEALIDALIVMGEDGGRSVEREDVRRELKSVIAMVQAGRENPEKKPSLQALFESCLGGAARLGIAVPDGLLMMVKSLITIEGLARGIDPEISLARVATPVLLKAARPSLKDLMLLGRNLPMVARQIFSR